MQRVININTSQIAHGYFTIEYDDYGALVETEETVVVGYTPSMIRMILIDENGIPTGRLYWYSTHKTVVFVDAGGAAVAHSIETSPITVNERGFVVDLSDALIESADVEWIVWETFGHEEPEGESAPCGQVYSGVGADDEYEEEQQL